MATGIVIGGAILGGIGQIKAGKEAKKLADANADMMRQETEESARRLEAQQSENMATARARAAASGTTGEGSQASFIEKMGSEFGKELAWLKKSGASAASIEQRRGSLERSRGLASGIGTIAGGIGTGYSMSGGNWGWGGSSSSGYTGASDAARGKGGFGL